MQGILRVCVFLGCCMTMLTASAAEPNGVFSLIDQRLSYMKDVAGYKAAHRLPIEDLAQEEQVLKQVMAEAEKKGIDPQSIKPFFIASINAAKAIQYRYLADWLSNPATGWEPRSLDKIRPEIASLSQQLIAEIYALLASGAKIDNSEQVRFMDIVHQLNLSDGDKIHIFAALQSIRLIDNKPANH
ncbi:putative chorismate mutase [Yersinia ruckeri]|uniref:chorismate mutase n=2 Tax=Yersinia ruckeri TaxID=29486 RepID=UPI0005AD31DB|nr:chorismate mutase [Yersinia ruckeri]AJI94910.1 putative chorismate mutase [Yersinia ruckeri]